MPSTLNPVLREFSGFIFDLDGLLIDSELIYREVWKTSARMFGYELSDEEHKSFLGRGRKGATAKLVEYAGASFDVEGFSAEIGKVEERIFAESEIPLKPGALQLLTVLKSEGRRMALATSTAKPRALERITRIGIDGYFEVIVGGNEVENGKPAPDIFLVAAERLGVEASRCVVFEDSDSGAEAALAANMKIFLVPDLKQPSEFLSSKVTGVVSSLEVFLNS